MPSTDNTLPSLLYTSYVVKVVTTRNLSQETSEPGISNQFRVSASPFGKKYLENRSITPPLLSESPMGFGGLGDVLACGRVVGSTESPDVLLEMRMGPGVRRVGCLG